MKRYIVLSILLILLFTSFSGCSNNDTSEPDEVKLFFAIHCEPGPFPNTTAHPEEYWINLVGLVKTADKHGHFLTILMNPQWYTFILEEPARLQLVRTWEDTGHELGLHSHGPSAGNWNGYTNDQEFTNHLKYQGTIQEMMNISLKVPQDHTIHSAAVTDQNQDTDFPETILYDVGGGWEGVDHLVSSPTKEVINGIERLQLNHARYSGEEGGGISVPLTILDEAIDNVSKDEVIGIVFHTFDYADMPLVYCIIDYGDLFTYLKQEKDVTSSTVSEILESY